MNSETFYKILKVLFIVSLILFLFIFLKYNDGDCGECNYDMSELGMDEEYNIREFLDYYKQECFESVQDISDLKFNLGP